MHFFFPTERKGSPSPTGIGSHSAPWSLQIEQSNTSPSGETTMGVEVMSWSRYCPHCMRAKECLYNERNIVLLKNQWRPILNQIKCKDLVCRCKDPTFDAWIERDTCRALGNGPPSLERTLGLEIPSSYARTKDPLISISSITSPLEFKLRFKKIILPAGSILTSLVLLLPYSSDGISPLRDVVMRLLQRPLRVR